MQLFVLTAQTTLSVSVTLTNLFGFGEIIMSVKKMLCMLNLMVFVITIIR